MAEEKEVKEKKAKAASSSDKTTEKKSEVIKEELETFVPPETIELSSGEVDFPKTTWKTESKILSELADIFDLPIFDQIDFDKFNSVVLLRVITNLVKHSPEKIEKIVCLLMDKDAKWVGDNLTIEDITKLLVPFFLHKGNLIREAWTNT